MTYIKRELEPQILRIFSDKNDCGLILAGIVGCGKTTVIEHCLLHLKNIYDVYSYTGDDTTFRSAISNDSKFLYRDIRSKTKSRVLIFVDEVQKSEEIFDAIKYIFDKGNASFIISGSNPDFLRSTARKRLQRRADFRILYPFSIPEILPDDNIKKQQDVFKEILFKGEIGQIPSFSVPPEIVAKSDLYLKRGGLPAAHFASSHENSLKEIQKVFERGFDPVLKDNDNISDKVAIELAELHALEFAYQNVLRKTGIRERNTVNKVITGLINHGYIVSAQPCFPGQDRRSYLRKYSYIDPGIVTYLTGQNEIGHSKGARIEGLIYSRLSFLTDEIPIKKKGVYYYKPYTVDNSQKIRFKKGEVDVVVEIGDRIIPMEIKATEIWQNIETGQIEEFMKTYNIPFGIILYEGEPRYRSEKSLLYWPYWLV